MSQTTNSIPDAVQVLLQQFRRLTVGEPITYDRMAIFPIFAGGNGKGREALRYRTLEQAIADGAVQVTERGSATVPELTLRNTGQAMVLIFDGEEIIGGQQNRVVNTTFLIPADATFDLPVSCVERGRWHTTSLTFSSGESAYHALRAAKHQQVSLSLKASGRPLSDQSKIWDEVAEREEATGKFSPTSSMHEIYRARDADLGAYQEYFAYVPGALGLIVALNGRVAGGDLFDQPETAQALWQKLVRSYALDALVEKSGEPVTHEQAERVLQLALGARYEVYPSLALGQDVRFEGVGVVGGGLVYEETPVHVNLFCIASERTAPSRRATLRQRRMGTMNARPEPTEEQSQH